MIRKLEEICALYFPRLVQVKKGGLAYLVLIHQEVISLDTTYNLGLVERYPLHFKSKLMPEKAALAQQGIHFKAIPNRPLPNNKTTGHPSLELVV